MYHKTLKSLVYNCGFSFLITHDISKIKGTEMVSDILDHPVTRNFLELFTTQSRLLMTLRKRPFKNIVGKGEIAGNQHFLLFPQCFLPIPKQISIFQSHLICRLQMLLIKTSLATSFAIKTRIAINLLRFSFLLQN